MVCCRLELGEDEWGGVNYVRSVGEDECRVPIYI